MDFFEWLTTKAPVVRHVVHDSGNDSRRRGTRVLIDKEITQPNYGMVKAPPPKREDNRWYFYGKEDRKRINAQRRARRERDKAEQLRLMARLQLLKQEKQHGN